jgi:hypothetical protein
MGTPILDAPAGRRDDFVDPYFRRAKTDEVVVILKAREPARIMIAIGSEDRWHLQLAQCWIVQYNFYINAQRWGRMFVRTSPYLPFSARVCLNQHHWLANRMRAEGNNDAFCKPASLNIPVPAWTRRSAAFQVSRFCSAIGARFWPKMAKTFRAIYA